METSNERLVPYKATHPGEVLREELKERGISQKDFAKEIGMQATHLNAFIKGKRYINDALALKLEKHLGIPYNIWMNLHIGYLCDCNAIEERDTAEQEARGFETICSELFNLRLLYKRLGISFYSCADRVKRLKEVCSLDLLSADKLKSQVLGMYKHSENVDIDEKNMLTWLILNHIATQDIKLVATYEKGYATKAAEMIAKMANDRTLSISAIKECLQQYGIAYMEVEKVEKAPVDAFSKISNHTPIITVTYRYNDLDKLAFDVIHELFHIENHLSDENMAFISMEGVEYSNDPREKTANEFAQNILIPTDIWNMIVSANSKDLSPYQVIKTIASEALKFGISPSIAISRYKHDTSWYRTSVSKSPKIH